MAKTTILIADDEPAVRDLIEDALGLAGYLVVTAKDGLEASSLAKKSQVKILGSSREQMHCFKNYLMHDWTVYEARSPLI